MVCIIQRYSPQWITLDVVFGFWEYCTGGKMFALTKFEKACWKNADSPQFIVANTGLWHFDSAVRSKNNMIATILRHFEIATKTRNWELGLGPVVRVLGFPGSTTYACINQANHHLTNGSVETRNKNNFLTCFVSAFKNTKAGYRLRRDLWIFFTMFHRAADIKGTCKKQTLSHNW